MKDNLNTKKGSNVVFYLSLVIILAMGVWSVAFNAGFTEVSNWLFTFLTTNFSWLYLIAMIVFLVFVIYVAIGKYGHIRLGGDDSRPEYKNMTWFGLLFGSGMGVGLVFWGVAEPVSLYLNPPASEGLEAGTAEAANFAITTFFMHWGVLPWATYAVIGLSLAYFMFRKNKRGLVSVLVEPLIGEERANGWIGKTIDVLAVFATVAGVVTSLGLGTLQINAGFNHLFGVPINLPVQVIIVAIVSVIYITSAVSGIGKGIKMISDVNIYVAIGLMIVCFIVGPRLEILNSLVNSLGDYFGYFLPGSLGIDAYGDNSWIYGGRIFYWAWFIAWAPFVGVFIARISKGRTIKEFVLGVVLVPTFASAIWGAIFGNLGINLGAKGIIELEKLAEIISTPEVGLFIVLQEYPLGFALALVAIISLCAFFITSANSGVYVLSMLTTNGDLNPPNNKKILWGLVLSLMAIGLLMAGGLQPLQTISLAAAFPFIFIMFAACAAFIKAIKKEKV